MKMTSRSKLLKQNTLGSIIRFYRELIKNEKVKPNGAAYNRMIELEMKYVKEQK